MIDIRKQMKIQTIGHDKVNQLRHARFFGDIHGMVQHMKKHADIIRPKNLRSSRETERRVGELGNRFLDGTTRRVISFLLMHWTDVKEDCGKSKRSRCNYDRGWRYVSSMAKIPHDSNIRIARHFLQKQSLQWQRIFLF